VAEKLRMLWSPEQIAGWLKHTYPCDESLVVVPRRQSLVRAIDTWLDSVAIRREAATANV